MKSGDDRLGDREAAHQLVHALNHFRRRLIGESHGKNGLRYDAEVLDQMGDAEGDDTRLPAAGTGENEQRSFGGLDSLTLLGVKLVEK